jgi:large subunit ribosomal protein L28
LIALPIFALHFQKFAKKMSKVCEITGKRARVGNNVSHANNKTKRTFSPNLHKKRFYIPEEDRWVVMKVSSKALRTINKNGLTAVLKKAKAKGTLTAKI